MADSLNFGGLYFIENLAINWADPSFFKPQRWIMKKGKVRVKTTYQIIPKNPLKQTVTQILKMEVNNNGKNMEFVDRDDLKIIFPEELRLLVEQKGLNITPKRLRFDFSHPEKLTEEQKKAVEEFVDKAILQKLPVFLKK